MTLSLRNVSLAKWFNPDNENGNDAEKNSATRSRYSLEFKKEAVQLVEGGQTIAAAARTLGAVGQTLFYWVKASHDGKLMGPDINPVSVEQMEISQLRAAAANR